MSLQDVWLECLEFHPQKRVVVENSGGCLSNDAGLLVIREFDQRVGFTEQFKVSDSLDQAAMNAWQLVQLLRSRGIDAYVFHDRYRSIATFGSFNSKKDPRIDETFDKFHAKMKRNVTTGVESFSAEIIYSPGAKKGDPQRMWIFDPAPYIIEVPKMK